MTNSELELIVQKHVLNKVLDRHQFRYEIYLILREMEKAFSQDMGAVYNAAGKFKGHIYSRTRKNNSVDKFYQFLYKKVNK